MTAYKKVPVPDSTAGLLALKVLIRERNPLAALQVFRECLGDIFQIELPGFKPIVMSGPDAARFVLVQKREDFRWRNESDPVTDLLRHGLLVEDGETHAEIRQIINPSLHRKMLSEYVQVMLEQVHCVLNSWPEDGVVDMLVETRKIALLILMKTLYQVDFYPHLKPLWNSILECIRYISPGLWMLWSKAPRRKHQNEINKLDTYLYQIIRERRKLISRETPKANDMLGLLIHSGMEDGLIRDQLLTMLIAGHDTVTALMAWTFFLLGTHPNAMLQVQEEAIEQLQDQQLIDMECINRMSYLGQVIKESLRLYPPIHLGSRLSALDLEYNGYLIPENTRVVYSIYLTHRHPDFWAEPNRFEPERFMAGSNPLPYSWLAFGGGPRNCIGAAFGQVEAKLVIGAILSQYRLELIEKKVAPHMGATLEPHPGVKMRVRKKV